MPKTSPVVPEHMNRAPRMPAARTFRFPLPESVEWPGGLRLLLLPKRDLPMVVLRLVFPTGTAADSDSEPGATYVTSRMLDRGAGSRTSLELSMALQELGAGLGTWCEQDICALSLRLLRPQLEPGLKLLADVLLRPRLVEDELFRLKQELSGQAIQRRAEPAQVAQLALKAAVFGSHPYGRPLLPLPPQIEGLTPARLKEQHARLYRPDGVILLAAGDISVQELRPLWEPVFSSWHGGPRAASAPLPPLPPSAPRLVLVDKPGATQAVIKVGHLGPPRATVDYPALELLNTILGGSFTSRLNQNLRERNGFTYGIRSSFFMRRDAGMFIVSTQVDAEAALPALREILHELSEIRVGLVTKTELKRARRVIIEDLPGQAETISALTDTYADLAIAGLPMDSQNALADAVQTLPPEAIRDAARRYLHPDAATLVLVGDLSRLRAPLEAVYGAGQLRDLDGVLIDR